MVCVATANLRAVSCLLLFITSGISGTPLKEVIKEIWLPLVTMLVVLVVITYFPEVVLFLPRVLMGYTG